MTNFVSELRKYGLATAWWNLRFSLGYRIGGFTAAQRRH